MVTAQRTASREPVPHPRSAPRYPGRATQPHRGSRQPHDHFAEALSTARSARLDLPTIIDAGVLLIPSDSRVSTAEYRRDGEADVDRRVGRRGCGRRRLRVELARSSRMPRRRLSPAAAPAAPARLSRRGGSRRHGGSARRSAGGHPRASIRPRVVHPCGQIPVEFQESSDLKNPRPLHDQSGAASCKSWTGRPASRTRAATVAVGGRAPLTRTVLTLGVVKDVY